jgi:hypothetical protein
MVAWLHTEMCYVFIYALNDEVSDNNSAVQNLLTYGRLISNTALSQDATVAQYTIPVRDSLGFTGRGTAGMTGERSRLNCNQP